MDETPLSSVDFSLQLVDDPLVFTTTSTASEAASQPLIAYTLSASKQVIAMENGRLGDWSVLQAFIAKTDIPIIQQSRIDSESTGCGYIDDGASFIVSSAMLTTYTSKGDLRNKVALKRIKQLVNEENLEAVCLEILALMHPPLRSHKNVIDLLGLTWTTEVEQTLFPVLVVEFAEFGSLDKYLGNHSLDTAAQASLCIGVAEGLDILHQCAIIHGDVKCENILITRSPKGDVVPKLADFGFSIVLPLEQLKAKLVGTPRWNAPELSEPRVSSIPRAFDLLPLLDIYSYGLLVWRVLKNGWDPFNGISSEDVLSLKVFGGNEVLRRAYQDVRGKFDREDPYLPVFEDILKRTLLRDPLERCRSLSWVKNSFQSQKTYLL
jgi:serine/threonine protein kinase